MQKIAKSLIFKVQNKQKELEEIEHRAESLKQPEVKTALQGIHSRAVAAVNLTNLDDKYRASNQIRLESNLLMMKFKEALKVKYLERNGSQSYGLKDEGSTMQMLRENINNSLGSYRKSVQKVPKT